MICFRIRLKYVFLRPCISYGTFNIQGYHIWEYPRVWIRVFWGHNVDYVSFFHGFIFLDNSLLFFSQTIKFVILKPWIFDLLGVKVQPIAIEIDMIWVIWKTYVGAYLNILLKVWKEGDLWISNIFILFYLYSVYAVVLLVCYILVILYGAWEISRLQAPHKL